MSRFREARSPDFDAIVDMMRAYYAEDGYPFSEPVARSALAEFVGNDQLGRLFVAEIGGQVAGYMVITFDFSFEYGGREAFLDEIFIGEAFRRIGLGREGVRLALDWSRREGIKAVHLVVERHREAARTLYEQMGFEEADRRMMTRRLTADME